MLVLGTKTLAEGFTWNVEKQLKAKCECSFQSLMMSMVNPLFIRCLGKLDSHLCPNANLDIVCEKNKLFMPQL